MATNPFEAHQQFNTALSSTFARCHRSSVKRTPLGVETIALNFGAIADPPRGLADTVLCPSTNFIAGFLGKENIMKILHRGLSQLALIAPIFAASPAHGQVLTFSGTRQNVNPLTPPGGRCVPPYFNTVNIAPGALSSTGTSNISNFTSTQSHCITSAPPTPLIDGLFTYTFAAGDTIFGTYTGNTTTSATPGTFNAVENLVITGGTGRFIGASGTISDNGTLRFATGNAIFQGTLSGSILAPTTTMSGSFSTALGVPSAATGDFSTAIGAFSFAPGARSTALGAFAAATGPSSVAAGDNSLASGMSAISIGQDSLSTGNGSTAVGPFTQAVGLGSTALGYAAVATQAGTLAGGAFATATGKFSTSLGRKSVASGTETIALGNLSAAIADQATAIGSGALASGAGSVALGQGSIATEANTVSVGSTGAERRIVNVASGTGPTDAVNFSQLSATNGSIATESASRVLAETMISTRLDNLSFDIRNTAREARGGTAAALAAAGLPQAQGEGRTMIAGGVGTYRGRTAVAIGASHRLQNGSGTFKVGLTYDSSHHTGANAGFGFEF